VTNIRGYARFSFFLRIFLVDLAPTTRHFTSLLFKDIIPKTASIMATTSMTKLASYAPPAIPKKRQRPQASDAKKRAKATKALIIHASDLTFKDHVLMHPIYQGKNMKILKMSPPSYPNPETRVPVRVQLSGGGRIPFDVNPNQYGAYMINFTLKDEGEIKALQAIDGCVLAYAIKHRRTLWPEDPDISVEAIRDRYRPLVVEGGKRDDGDRWDPSIKLKIPINLNTGEPNACKLNGRTKVCRILDSDDSILSMYDMEKREWERIVFDMSGIYFQSKAWGIGPKFLSIIKLSHDHEAEADYQEVDLLPPPLERQTHSTLPEFDGSVLTQQIMGDGTLR